MKHVRPDRFASGLSPEERAHVSACPRCTTAERRVSSARRAMAELAAAPAPTPSGDLGARAYWAASSEIHRRRRPGLSRPWASRLFAPLLVATAVGVAVFVSWSAVRTLRNNMEPRAARTTAPIPTPVASPQRLVPPSVPVPAPAPTPLAGLVMLVQGDVTLDGRPLTADIELGPGARLEAREGRVAVQFGDHSGFALEPDSRAVLTRFDELAVNITLVGAIAVELEHRRPEQSFTITAGRRQVAVRGTVFRVADRAGALEVAVTRGRVAVLEGRDVVEVPAGARLTAPDAASLAGVRVAPVAEKDAAALAASVRVPLVPSFPSASAARGASSVLTVAAAAGTRVKVDGVEVGAGRLVVRAAAGRHLIETARSARWVELAPGGSATADVVEAATGQSERPAQVDAQLEAHRGAIFRCADAMHKMDPGFSAELRVSIGVGADGSVGFVAPIGAVVQGPVEDCILDVIRDRFTFPVGTPATVQKVIRF